MIKYYLFFLTIFCGQILFSQSSWADNLNILVEPVAEAQLDTVPPDSILFDFSVLTGLTGIIHLQFHSIDLTANLDSLQTNLFIGDSIIASRVLLPSELNQYQSESPSDNIFSIPIGSAAYSEDLNFSIQKFKDDGSFSEQLFMQE